MSNVGEMVERSRKCAEQLLDILDLEPVERNLFLGKNEHRDGFRLFGGQVLAQALRAASHTVEGRFVHSLHGYFLRPGSASKPVLYEVDRIRDGRSFTTRRVVAIQNGEAIFELGASFQVVEDGFDHSQSMPNVPPPDELEDDGQAYAALAEGHPALTPFALRARPFELRSVFRPGSEEWQRDRFWNPVWIRFRLPVPDDAALKRSLLAYASDMGMVSTASLPHTSSTSREGLQMASLDHALWIHRDVPMDGWLLFHKRTSVADGARGLCHADFYDISGQLIASVSQEGLIRPLG